MGPIASDHVLWKPDLCEDCCFEQSVPCQEEIMLTSIPFKIFWQEDWCDSAHELVSVKLTWARLQA